MKFLVDSPEVRLEAIRDLKAAGFGATAPKEEDQGDSGYTLVVDGSSPSGQRAEEIVVAVDPAARRID